MSIRRSAGGIFWGLILIAVGGLFLARNLGYSIPIWRGIARYWPLLLIVWGGLKLVDYFRYRRSGEDRPLFSGGEVALLIMVILAGTAVTTAANISPNFGNIGNIFEIGDLDLWDITGNNFEYSEHLEADVPSGSTIEILNMFGNVDVQPSDRDRVILDVKKTVRASDKDEADRRSKDFTFSITNEGSKYRIASNRDQPGGQRRYFKSSMTIQVPKQSLLQIDNRQGRVTVQNLLGRQNIVNRFGPVDVRRITGVLEVENRNGAVTVEEVTESVTINNSYSSTSARNIGGNVEIHNRNGSVAVSGVQGTATIANSYGPITVENVQRDVSITGRNNSVEVERVEGGVTVEASYQNVNVRDAKGSVTVRNRNGDVVIGFAKPPQKDISVSTQYSNVTLELPSTAFFSIDAKTRYGSINSEFDGLNNDVSSNRERSLRGRLGQDGPQIHIDTRNGDIRLEKKG